MVKWFTREDQEKNHKTYENWIESWSLTYFSQDDASASESIAERDDEKKCTTHNYFMHLKKD